MALPSHAEYERREIAEAHARMEEVRKAPLSDRREARREMFEAMELHPDLIAERIGWLIDGSYGYGAMLLAKRVLERKRMNRAAALTQMIGVFEWGCPEDFTRDAWKKLSGAQQDRLLRLVSDEIEENE